MIELDFIVRGNHEDPDGNPVPYTRTLSQAWTKAASRYKEWQEYVRAEFYRSCKMRGRDDMSGVPVTTSGMLELAKGQEVEVDIEVVWASGHHGDLDNILKGILDALFAQDKEVTEIHAVSSRGKKGRIAGRITITEKS